ncbi:uncharacterized protein PV09_06796 [Verruconis gallopava]|uniref:Protein BCP1 n=1 Tax=Verruconis gallopava TaxID=253628 RepID=A0A0D2AS06_9PEZI|nr:uncharacterized protein PV09_06796 [Verruconis gallopava]KIW01959.1 hypothetical protein PV09_06796 [Verruconis gallopava]
MPKRKSENSNPQSNGRGQDESDDESDLEMLDVDFEWFDPQPQFDFHGLKTLCRQLFDIDAQLFDLSALVELILSQPLLGSTVKVDGNETDPYAFLTVLNLHVHRELPVIKNLTNYLARQASGHLSKLPDLLSAGSNSQVGLILTERLLNMPSEISPPMYTMLLEEIQWALEEKEPYEFTHYLIWSKVYHEVVSTLDAEDAERPKKKSKASKQGMSDEVFYFHPEDEILHKYSLAYGNFEYEIKQDDGASDARRVFSEAGIKPMGHLILIEASRFADAVKAIADYLKPPS